MEKILVPIDGSPDADNALRHVIAQFLANPAKEIHVLNVQPSLSQHIARFAGSRERAAWHREQADQALTGARALLSQHVVPHAVHLKTGDAAQVIIALAEEGLWEEGADGVFGAGQHHGSSGVAARPRRPISKR